MRTALLVNGVWTALAGIVLFFPSIGAAVFAYPIKDPAVTSGWGSSLIVIGTLAFLASQDTERYGRLAWVFAGGLLLTTVDLLYFWLTGAYTARTVLPPIVINLVLVVWIWTSRPRA
ncbi:MAG: hypothetical protein QN193_10850 [Armatimonadota bacterium]|nr:hypothetical protein [Armatimonadota bacterium]MDR7445199.1 hypothetical protein [Armatimonadota bacterium]MDR7571092.1 hypothetical protein [Armatimonadota bacterium]MDR7613700.1 hypothetical protein [Armatimonadota bacterium]